ncbi:hypothetical protein ACE1TI_06345 [Alteribacillus sp. JSM 102045]|uniref:hypothetical protein n=1 Tax=Alteribacillus sp. JSM 102045 TaxID=1562101 RepID=UPI0035C1852C
MNSNRQGDQAENLRRRAQRKKLNRNSSIDVTSLPPRKEVHKKKVRMNFPMARLLLLLFIFIVLIAAAVFFLIG